jgi:hypothetical protein
MVVFVVTRQHEGCRFTVAVFSGVKYETLEQRFPLDEFDIEEIVVEKNLKDWH